MIPAGAEALLFGKSHLGFGRIVATGVVLAFGLLLTAALWAPLERRVGWFILPLGRNSLRCYALHTPAVYGAAIFLHGSNLVATSSREVNTVLQLAALLFVWLGVRWLVVHRARTTPEQRPIWTASAPRRLQVARSLVLSLLRV